MFRIKTIALGILAACGMLTTAAANGQGPLPEVQSGVYRSGGFAARVESAAVSESNGYGKLSVMLTFFNTGREPLAFVPLNPNYSGTVGLTDTGVTFSTNGGSPGITECWEQSATLCRSQHASAYTQIDPGNFATINMVLSGWVGDERRVALMQSRIASITMRVNVIEGVDNERTVQLSLSGIKVRPF